MKRIFSLSTTNIALGVGNNVAAVHLHKVWLYEKPCLAAAGTADNKDVFVPCVFGLLRAAANHQPFGLRQNDVVLKYRVNIGFYILCAAP